MTFIPSSKSLTASRPTSQLLALVVISSDSIDCAGQIGEPFEWSGLEFVVLTVHGQSFMLHQIRKMIG